MSWRLRINGTKVNHHQNKIFATFQEKKLKVLLKFAGFIAFQCKTRGDSGVVISSLRASRHECSMITGDAPLTALHAARSQYAEPTILRFN